MDTEPQAGEAEPAGMRLLVGACGAGNVLNLPAYLVRFHALPCRSIRVVMTEPATRMLPPASVGSFCDDVYTGREHRFKPGHVSLAHAADVMIILPATAHFLAVAAHGLAGNLLGATLLAYPRRAVFFPSMNTTMWNQPSVQRNVAQLRQDGHLVVPPPLVESWTMSSGTFERQPGMPSPDRAAEIVREWFRLIRANESTGTGDRQCAG